MKKKRKSYTPLFAFKDGSNKGEYRPFESFFKEEKKDKKKEITKKKIK